MLEQQIQRILRFLADILCDGGKGRIHILAYGKIIEPYDGVILRNPVPFFFQVSHDNDGAFVNRHKKGGDRIEEGTEPVHALSQIQGVEDMAFRQGETGGGERIGKACQTLLVHLAFPHAGTDKGEASVPIFDEVPGGEDSALVVVQPHVDYLPDAAVTVGENEGDIIVLLNLLDVLVKGAQKDGPLRFPGTEMLRHVGIVMDKVHHGLVALALDALHDIAGHGRVERGVHRVLAPVVLDDDGDDAGGFGGKAACGGIRHVAVFVYDILYFLDVLLGNLLIAMVRDP